MKNKKETLISKVTKKFSKKKEVEKNSIITEQDEEKLKRIYQAYYDEKSAMDAKERLESANAELWLSGLGG